MKEILSIIGKALTDIAGVLPDRAAPDTRWKEAKKKIMSEINSDTERAVKPMETWKEEPPVGEFKDAPELNECVETGELLAPPVQTAPTVQAAPPVQADTELDSEGIPWDKRIHSSGKTKYKQTVGDKKEGSWIHKKGVDPILLAQVKTELFQKYHAVEPVVDQFQAAAPLADAPQEQPDLGYINNPGNIVMPTADPTPPVQQPTAPGELPPYGSITKWAPLMREAAGKGINHVAADGILAAAGLPTIAALQNTPSSIPAAALALGLTGPQS